MFGVVFYTMYAECEQRNYKIQSSNRGVSNGNLIIPDATRKRKIHTGKKYKHTAKSILCPANPKKHKRKQHKTSEFRLLQIHTIRK